MDKFDGLTFSDGDIFESDCEALVNPVNVSPGYMGALAGVFSRKFPGLEVNYLAAVERGETGVGKLIPFRPTNSDVEWIINFPTTPTMGAASNLEFIITGLESLTDFCDLEQVKSIAIPALGCGVGGLDWEEVKFRIKFWYGNSNFLFLNKVVIFNPK